VILADYPTSECLHEHTRLNIPSKKNDPMAVKDPPAFRLVSDGRSKTGPTHSILTLHCDRILVVIWIHSTAFSIPTFVSSKGIIDGYILQFNKIFS